MAHAGKLYPLHFRRDLNLNSGTNTTGWPRAFGGVADDQFGTVGQDLEGNRWVLIAVDERTHQAILYESQYIRIAGRDIKLRVEGTNAAFVAFTGVQISMIDRVAGIIGTGGASFPTNGRYGSIVGGWNPSFTPRPDLFQATGQGVVLFTAIKWPEWNSL